MAADGITPVDIPTGLPLPLLPTDRYLSLDRSDEANWHHHAHPRKDPLLKGVGGVAVRTVRLQLSPFNEHNNYHNYYVGPELPVTAEQQFSYVVMAAAGYVPSEALDVRTRKPKIVPIDQGLRNKLWQSGELKPSSLVPIQSFMKSYVLDQDFSHLHENMVDELLNTTNHERKQFLGHLLLAKVIEHAVEPLDTIYRRAHNQGLIYPGSPIKLPTFVSSALGRAKQRSKLVREFHTTVASKVA